MKATHPVVTSTPSPLEQEARYYLDGDSFTLGLPFGWVSGLRFNRHD